MSAEQSLPSAEQLHVDALRAGIGGLMQRCTEKQIALLHTIHDNAPWKGLTNCPDGRLAETYDLLCRTVAKNEAKP